MQIAWLTETDRWSGGETCRWRDMPPPADTQEGKGERPGSHNEPTKPQTASLTILIGDRWDIDRTTTGHVQLTTGRGCLVAVQVPALVTAAGSHRWRVAHHSTAIVHDDVTIGAGRRSRRCGARVHIHAVPACSAGFRL